MDTYVTATATELAGVSLPTFRLRVRALNLKPISTNKYGGKMWSAEQINQISAPPRRCNWCGSPYHTSCYLRHSPRADEHAEREAACRAELSGTLPTSFYVPSTPISERQDGISRDLQH